MFYITIFKILTAWVVELFGDQINLNYDPNRQNGDPYASSILTLYNGDAYTDYILGTGNENPFGLKT